MFTLDTAIESPRLIASGRGSWSGTLRDLIQADGERVVDYVTRNHDVDAWTLTGEELATVMNLQDLTDILDNPNVKVS